MSLRLRELEIIRAELQSWLWQGAVLGAPSPWEVLLSLPGDEGTPEGKPEPVPIPSTHGFVEMTP